MRSKKEGHGSGARDAHGPGRENDAPGTRPRPAPDPKPERSRGPAADEAADVRPDPDSAADGPRGSGAPEDPNLAADGSPGPGVPEDPDSAADPSPAPGSSVERRPARASSVDVAALIGDAVRDLTPEEVPARLCALAVDLLPVSGASMSLRSDGLPVRLGASDAKAARIADAQGTLGEGPGLDAASAGRPVLACDLTSGGDAVRWPVFAQQATEAGARAMYSLPLGDASVCVGTLDLYRDVPAEPTGNDLRTAHLVADVVTLALMSLPRGEWTAARGDESWLSTLASDHDEIHQAIGMIMAQLGICADDALARLRGYAFSHSRTAGSAAREVLAHRKRFHRE